VADNEEIVEDFCEKDDERSGSVSDQAKWLFVCCEFVRNIAVACQLLGSMKLLWRIVILADLLIPNCF
jgi:hypothetical protein